LDADYSNLRHAINTAAAVDALAARIYWSLHNSGAAAVAAVVRQDDGFRDVLAGKDPSFAMIRDIAKGQKHVQLTKGYPQIAGASSIGAKPVAYGRLPYGRGRYGGVSQVIVETKVGAADYVESLLDQAITFLEGEMATYGL
jgi:hypothetical protein